MKSLQLNKKQLLTIGIAFLAGAFWIVALRFITYNSDTVHYHANFAIFVDGERRVLNSPSLYEEVQLCGGDEINNPRSRVHMHDQIDHVVHVHDAAATWGHFFANIGMTNGDSVFRIDREVFVEDEDTKITFVLNGEEIPTTANRHIGNEDVLLVSIGSSSDEDLTTQYDQIKKDASEYNSRTDPSSCSGGKEASFVDRIKNAIGLFN